MILFSPAKLNLFLRVLKKRADGYHDLATLMQTINLGDTLTINNSSKDAFHCSEPSLPMDESNLVVKALRAFRTYTGNQEPVEMTLEKKIPTQAGMGGGSSNAATTLWGLNTLFKTNLTQAELITLAAQLGSDVPFFFSSGRALCLGRGEIVQSLDHREAHYTVYQFHEGASTARIFQACTPTAITDSQIFTLVAEHQNGLAPFTNDLEPVTERLLPSINEWKKTLPEPVVMTGTGSSYFCAGIKKLSGQKSWNVKTVSRTMDQWY